MSARFGRNKRRAAREAIAALEQRKAELEQGMAMDRALLRSQGQHLRELQDEIARAKEIAGPYSSLFKPEVVETGMPRPRNTRDGQWRVYSPEPISLYAPSDMDKASSIAATSVPLDIFLESVDVDMMRQACHALLQYKDGTMAYGISQMAMMNDTPDGIARALQRNLPSMVRGLYEQARITPRRRRA